MSPNPLRSNLLAVLVTVAGCLQMAGHLSDAPGMRMVSAAFCAAPFPRAFADVEGLEPFASTGELRGVDGGGRTFARPITPEVFERMDASGAERAVYRATFSLAPRLPEPLWRGVVNHGLEKDGPLRRALDLPPAAHDLTVIIRTQTFGKEDVWIRKTDSAR